MRRLLALATSIAALGLLPAAAAASSTRVGHPQSAPPGGGMGSGTYLNVQTAPASPSYVLPAGIVTSWSFYANTTPGQVRLKVFRPAGGGQFTVVAQSDYQSVAASSLNTFATHLQVQAGDLIGVTVAGTGSGPQAWYTAGATTADKEAFWANPEPALLSSSSPAFTADQFLMNISATVLSDSDSDGRADDTEDNCPSVANPDQANADGDALGDACDADDDNDGLSDADEAAHGTNPLVADTDGDGTGDAADNCGTIPNDQADADADGQGNACDADDDNDGVPDAVEAQRGTSPTDLDSDDDGIADGAETASDPRRKDTDRDGLTDGVEQGVTARIPGFASVRGTDGTGFFPIDRDPRTRTDPGKADTDGDGLKDGIEDLNKNGRKEAQEMSPLKADTDNDGIKDGREDANANGARDPNETNPLRRDTDRDGLLDGAEDRNRDGRRQRTETNPRKRDTDGDGVSDKRDRRPLDPKRH
ncbi:MAG: thrombospondin type 3 repeat-containing protein [Solirubrobacteraceae bacterium]